MVHLPSPLEDRFESRERDCVRFLHIPFHSLPGFSSCLELHESPIPENRHRTQVQTQYNQMCTAALLCAKKYPKFTRKYIARLENTTKVPPGNYPRTPCCKTYLQESRRPHPGADKLGDPARVQSDGLRVWHQRSFCLSGPPVSWLISGDQLAFRFTIRRLGSHDLASLRFPVASSPWSTLCARPQELRQTSPTPRRCLELGMVG